jgi:hypothetical protein
MPTEKYDRSKKEHIQDMLSSVYLTLVGIIQATVFTKVCYDLFDYMQKKMGELQVDIFGLFCSIDFWWDRPAFYFAMLATVVVVTYEYIYFAATAVRIVRVKDVLSIFILGTAQVWMASAIGSPMEFWVASCAFAFSGFYAYYISIDNDWNSAYDGHKKKVGRQNSHLLLRLSMTVVAFLIGASFVFWAYNEQFRDAAYWAGLPPVLAEILTFKEWYHPIAALAYSIIWSAVFWRTGDDFAVRQQSDEEDDA